MSEVAQQTLDQNLQIILDRYSLVGTDSNPNAVGIRNADRRYMNSLGARKGRLYGELTTCGIALVWADFHKTDYCEADVLIIDSETVVAGSHIYQRSQGRHDWYDHTGPSAYTSISLAGHADSLTTMPYELSVGSKHGKEFERGHAAYMRTAKALAKFAGASDQYDALHQTVASRDPLVPKNLEQLHPYAGQLYGPRVNLQEMIDANVEFHPAVIEALRFVPEMTIDS